MNNKKIFRTYYFEKKQNKTKKYHAQIEYTLRNPIQSTLNMKCETKKKKQNKLQNDTHTPDEMKKHNNNN